MRALLFLFCLLLTTGPLLAEDYSCDSFSFAVPQGWKIAGKNATGVLLRHERFMGGSELQVAYQAGKKPADVIKMFMDYYRKEEKDQGNILLEVKQEEGSVQDLPAQIVDIVEHAKPGAKGGQWSEGGSATLVVVAGKQGTFASRLFLAPCDSAGRQRCLQDMQALMGQIRFKK